MLRRTLTFEGAPARFSPFASVLAPPNGCAAGPNGVTIGRFGWLDPSVGEVSNFYAPNTILGLVLPQNWRYWRNGWTLAYWDCGLVLRSGMNMSMAARGEFWVRFAGGAQAGQQVFASTLDGSAATGIAGPEWTADSDVTADSVVYTADGGGWQPTKWTVMMSVPPCAFALISSWSAPFYS